MPSARDHFVAGIAVIVPMLPGVAPFGMVTGLTAVNAGLSPEKAMGMSVFIFAGASQLATLQLLGQGAIPVVILLTALTINLRFAMYSASIAPHFQHLRHRWRWPLAYLLTDQAYAVSVARFRNEGGADPDTNRHWYYLGAGLTLWIAWQAATAIGAYLGGSVPHTWSLDFAIPLMFMGLLVPGLRDRPNVIAALTGGTIATLAANLPLHLGIVVAALAGIAAGVIAERRWPRARHAGGDEAAREEA